MADMQSDELQKKLAQVEEFECMVCFQYMEPPIFGCRNGHKACFNCLWRVKHCPMCRVSLTKMFRARKTEELYWKSWFPCKNSSSGCKEWIQPASDVQDHQVICIYNATTDPVEETQDDTNRLATMKRLLEDTNPEVIWNRDFDGFATDSLNEPIDANFVFQIRDMYHEIVYQYGAY